MSFESKCQSNLCKLLKLKLERISPRLMLNCLEIFELLNQLMEPNFLDHRPEIERNALTLGTTAAIFLGQHTDIWLYLPTWVL